MIRFYSLCFFKLKVWGSNPVYDSDDGYADGDF